MAEKRTLLIPSLLDEHYPLLRWAFASARWEPVLLDGDWRELLRRAEEAPPAAVPETLLERLGTYFAFRYLLKAVNDGDLLGQAQFCVLMVLTAQRLTAVCGFWEAVRRLCCEVEHSEENLEALRLAFLRDAALSPGAFCARCGVERLCPHLCAFCSR